jgi:hypothetical protein
MSIINDLQRLYGQKKFLAGQNQKITNTEGRTNLAKKTLMNVLFILSKKVGYVMCFLAIPICCLILIIWVN